MQRVPVDSSSILEVGYQSESSTMEILFKDGRLYQYFDVPNDVYENLVTAPSVGRYFHLHVRGIYRYARV